MLADVRTASEARLREVRLSLEALEREEQPRPAPASAAFKAAKGLFFVHLYGALEFTVAITVQRALSEINSSGTLIRHLKPVVLSLALDPECRAVGDVGARKQWERRIELFSRVVSSEPAVMNVGVFPADSGNIKYEHLDSVWRAFAVGSPVLPRMSVRGRLHEVTDNRNAVAHGRETPVAVGGRYSVLNLREIYDDIDALCTHLIQSFHDYLEGAHYRV